MPDAISADHDDYDGSIDGHLTDRAGSRRRSGVKTSPRHIRSWRAFLLSNRDALPHSCRLPLSGEGAALEHGITCPKASTRIRCGVFVRRIHFEYGRRLKNGKSPKAEKVRGRKGTHHAPVQHGFGAASSGTIPTAVLKCERRQFPLS